MQKIWTWLEGKKTKIGAALLCAAAVLGVAYGQVSAMDGLTLFSAGAIAFGWADKTNRHQQQILQALTAVSTVRGAGVAGAIKVLEPIAVSDAVAAAQNLTGASGSPDTGSISVKSSTTALLALFVLFAFAATAHAQAHYRHHAAAVLNDLEATPGDVDVALTKAKLCDPSFHTATARSVTESQKKRICAAYDQKAGCPGSGYEIDHLISIELGGANTDANLWPQPVDAPGVIGFHTKDKVENALHRLVCSGGIALPAAQKCIAGDWYACAREEGILPAPKS